MDNYVMSIVDTDETVDFDSLPVAKITHYPLEKWDYKPYAQASLYLDKTKLGIRLAAFEVNPSEDSKIGCVLYIFPKKPIALEMLVTPDTVTVLAAGNEINATYHKNVGEDLQGVYWGYDVFVKRKDLEEIGRIIGLEEGTFNGNFFKSKESLPKHFGTFARINAEKEGSLSEQSMAKIKTAKY